MLQRKFCDKLVKIRAMCFMVDVPKKSAAEENASIVCLL